MDRAESSVAQELDGLGEHGAAAPLGTDRHDAVVAARRLDHPAPFDDVMADRLLAIDGPSRLTCPDRHQRMPVVGGGDGHGVDVAILEHAAEVALGFRIPSPTLLRGGERSREMPFVDVDDVADTDVLDRGKMFVVILPAAAGGPG